MSEPDAPLSGATASPATSNQVPADRLFAGRYRLSGRRGSGLDVALFEAVDVLRDRTVAVKIIHPDICARPRFDERFTHVVQQVAALRHPNITQIIDVGAASWSGLPVRYVVCENLTGGSMRDLRDRGRQLTPSQVVMVGLDVCRGLDVSHRAGLVHGDIRPANLVFGDDGKLRITDLGVAELVAESIWSNPAAVSVDRARYASPEQAMGMQVGPKSDVYSLSLCLLEAVTGQLPFVGDSTVATLSNRIDKLMPVSADLGPLAAVLERAGRPDPLDRFTAAEFGKALVQAAERLPRPVPIALLSTGLFGDQASASDPNATTQLRRVSAPIDGTGVSATADVEAAPSVGPTIIDTPSTGPIVLAPEASPDPSTGLLRAVAEPPTPAVPPAPAVPRPSTVPPAPAVTPVASAAQPIPNAMQTGALVQPVPGAEIPPPPQPEPPLLRQSSARRKLMAVVAIIVVAAAIGGALAWFVGRDQSNAVPDVVGLQQGEALNMISEFGWTVTTSEEFSDEVAAGAVLGTDPAAGAKLDQGDALAMVISSGPAPRVLPELVGLTVEQATAALDQLDLVLERGDTVNDDVVPADQIISWSVPAQTGLAAGDTVVRGTSVRVIVSSGPAPRTVPDLANLSLDEATIQLQLNALVITQAADEFSDTTPIGAVARQDPAPGTPLPIGSAVTVVISKGSEFVVVPPLADLNVQQASEALIASGLVLGEVKGDPNGVNVLAEVGGVSIGSTTSFPRGTVVDLTFAVPPPPTPAPPETVPSQTTVSA